MDKHGTDKCYHGYAEHYEILLKPFRNRELTLMEIGVLHGHSLKVWQDYLPYSTVVGFDRNFPKNIPSGTRFFKGDQGSIMDLMECEMTFGPFDIIIDDGSHRTRDHLASFDTLYPRMNNGGLYVIEDLDFAPGTVNHFRDHPDATLLDCYSFLIDRPQQMLVFRKVPHAA